MVDESVPIQKCLHCSLKRMIVAHSERFGPRQPGDAIGALSVSDVIGSLMCVLADLMRIIPEDRIIEFRVATAATFNDVINEPRGAPVGHAKH